MNDARRLDILRAIVQDYVATCEPVGSKALLERHELGVSAATVRNDMAVLEEEGLVVAPHTSAGRIPTDAGYRLFVDQLSQAKVLSRAEKAAIQRFLSEAVDLDDVVDRTARMLSSLTGQVAVMQYPSLDTARIRHVEFVALAPGRVLIVLIYSTGRVEQRVVDRRTEGPEVDLDLSTARNRVNDAVTGHTRSEAIAGLAALDLGQGVQDELTRQLAAALAAILGEEREDRVVLAGTSHLARNLADFHSTLGPVLEALEEQVVLLKLLGHLHDDAKSDVVVRIGAENTVAGLQSTSLVATSYDAGTLAVLGPTRMDYPTTMAAVRAVAHYVSDLLQ